MNRAETTNEELSNLLDGPFVEDWTLAMELEDSLNTDSLNFPSIQFPHEISMQSLPATLPPLSVHETTDQSTNLFSTEVNVTKDCYLNPSVDADAAATILNLFHPHMGNNTGQISFACGFTPDPILHSVPETDPVTGVKTLSMDETTLPHHRHQHQHQQHYGMECETALQSVTPFHPYHTSALSSSSSSFPMHMNYSTMESETTSALLHSRTNESDSNCSHESSFQAPDNVFKAQEPNTYISCNQRHDKDGRAVYPSTVVSSFFESKMLEPSLLETTQKQVKMEPGQPQTQGYGVLSGTGGDQSVFKVGTTPTTATTMLTQLHQSAPQMKLPSLPGIHPGQSTSSTPVLNKDNTQKQPSLSWNGNCFVVGSSPHFEQNSTTVMEGHHHHPSGLFGFHQHQRDLQTTQSNSNLSSLSTNTTGESILCRKNMDCPSMTTMTAVDNAAACVHSNGAGNVNVSVSNNISNKSSNKTVISRISAEERQMKILRYRQKRTNRRFNRGVTYQCRKTLADSRPRVRGRFAKNDDIHAILPPKKLSQTKSHENSQTS